MGFEHYEARVPLPDEVWAGFPDVQIFLSQVGEELRIVIVPTEERLLLPGVIQDQPEVTFLHPPSAALLAELVPPWRWPGS